MTNTGDVAMTAEEALAAFGVNPEHVGYRNRGWRVIGPEVDWEEAAYAGASPGDLAVDTRDGADNEYDDGYDGLPNFLGSLEDSGDRTYRTYFFAPLSRTEGNAE